MKRLITNIGILLFFVLAGCDNIKVTDSIREGIIGTWVTDEGNVIKITEGDYIVEGEGGHWKYKFVKDSLFTIYDSPFDDAEEPLIVRVLSIQENTVEMYDSAYSQKVILSRKK